jgi:hypothetical protein
MPDFERAASTRPDALPSTDTVPGPSESPVVNVRLVSALASETVVTPATESVSALIVFALV